MIHSLIQAALGRGRHDRAFLEAEAEAVVRAATVPLYEVGMAEAEALEKLREVMPAVRDL
eukprot:CAMPEP_0119151802 /NCGR_PEP_ID=MMETSP1310-20130426/46824_1 /TAXON_ID=464262 /ORGANISM="Genus nov. species nov., Strain RCC2339" /LENGTH=59 /DNA_ID=CAMNT_0007144109 /DNA_START=1 /DNA_END=177 /DNA_ORIENTATION=+